MKVKCSWDIILETIVEFPSSITAWPSDIRAKCVLKCHVMLKAANEPCFVFVVEAGDEQESEESGEEEGEEEGTESDLVRPSIITQSNCYGVQLHFIFFTSHCKWLSVSFWNHPLCLSASEHRVQSEEEVEKENKTRQRLAEAVQETKEEDKGQRWSCHRHTWQS